jgi:hypothetical protein
MIRTFDLRDLPLARRLRDQTVSLHAESALTNGMHLLRNALTGMVIDGDLSTFVWKSDDGAAVIQIHVNDDGDVAKIVSISLENYGEDNEQNSSDKNVNETAWLALLDGLVYEVGKRGIHSLVAEVDELGEVLVMLRRAGFAVYTRQDIWTLTHSDIEPNGSLLQERTVKDDWDINLLYANTVPRLIQLIEPVPPMKEGPGWVLHEDGELVAFVQRHDGTEGSYLRLFVHPGAHTNSDEIVQSILKLKSPSLEQPLFCCVPRYQSWLQSSLQTAGFEHLGSQAVMVKHTTQRIQKESPDLARVIQGKQIVRSVPYVRKHK